MSLISCRHQFRFSFESFFVGWMANVIFTLTQINHTPTDRNQVTSVLYYMLSDYKLLSSFYIDSKTTRTVENRMKKSESCDGVMRM